MVSSLYLFLSLLISLSNFNPFSETMRSKVKQNIKYILVYSCIPLFYIRRSVLSLIVLCSPFSHYFMTAYRDSTCCTLISHRGNITSNYFMLIFFPILYFPKQYLSSKGEGAVCDFIVYAHLINFPLLYSLFLTNMTLRPMVKFSPYFYFKYIHVVYMQPWSNLGP